MVKYITVICLENYLNSQTPTAAETFCTDFGHDHSWLSEMQLQVCILSVGNTTIALLMTHLLSCIKAFCMNHAIYRLCFLSKNVRNFHFGVRGTMTQ